MNIHREKDNIALLVDHSHSRHVAHEPTAKPTQIYIIGDQKIQDQGKARATVPSLQASGELRSDEDMTYMRKET
jgi:hypothetical protein